MRILVTGSSGQLGNELKEIFYDKEVNNVVFLGRAEMPLEDIESIAERLKIVSPDIIIHTAAYTAVDQGESEVELLDKVNYQATREIARFCSQNECKLIFISTDYVFDGSINRPLKEVDLTGPINQYGRSKLLAETAVIEYVAESIIIRTSWVYSTYGKNFVKTMIKLMSERDSISVVDDQFGSPTYAADLASAIETIVLSPCWKSGVYHFSNEGDISWYEFAMEIKAICKLKCEITPVNSDQYKTIAKRPKYSLLDTTKIKTDYNIEISNWKSSLSRMLQKYCTDLKGS